MPTKNGDKSQVDNSRLNISGEALVIVDDRVFRASIDIKKNGYLFYWFYRLALIIILYQMYEYGWRYPYV